MARRDGFLWLGVVVAMCFTQGCDEEASIGERDAASGDAGTEGDGAMIADAAMGTDASTDVDAAVVPADAAVVLPPPFLDIFVGSAGRIDVVSDGSSLVPTLVPSQTISVLASTTRAMVTTHPTGTLGGCDLYPPVGASSWPPATTVEGTPAELPVEYVSITADGAPLAIDAVGTQGAMARAELAPGAHIVVTVTYPGHAGIAREVDLETYLALESPTVRPSIDHVLRGTYVSGSDLDLVWPVDHDTTARQIVDVFGAVGAVRCERTHGAGGLTLSAADVGTGLLGGGGVYLGVSLYASSFEESFEGTTSVRVSRSWSTASVGLDVAP